MMPQIYKTRATCRVLTLWICCLVLFAVPAAARSQSGVPDRLVVGVMDFPPFVMPTEAGEWEGLSIGLLQSVAQDLDTTIELREFTRMDQVEKALVSGEVDLIPVAAVTESLERLLDFSNPYYRSGAAIVVKAQESESWPLLLVELFFSIAALKVAVALALLWMIAGWLVWLFEKRHERTLFSGGIRQGVGTGMWWAAVTMTTVGYGDKAPKTAGGRVVAVIWMFISIVLISGLTATVATTLTVGELRGKVYGFEDLPKVRVGTLAQSQYLESLSYNGISPTAYKGIPAGLKALSDGDIDAFVHDEALLRYLVRAGYADTLKVLPDTFKHYFLCMALPPGSKLREPLNRSLLKAMARENWRVLVEGYMGSHRM